MKAEKIKERLAQLQRRLTDVKKEEETIRDEIKHLKSSCIHEFRKDTYGEAKCGVCETRSGWWCPDSPDHLCDYTQEDGEYDEDCCRYCGHPEERK